VAIEWRGAFLGDCGEQANLMLETAADEAGGCFRGLRGARARRYFGEVKEAALAVELGTETGGQAAR